MELLKVKLEDIAEEKRENYEPKSDESLNYIGLEHIEQQTLRINGIGKSNETISSKKKFNSGDILFGSLRPYFRKVYKPDFSGVCSTDITVIKSKENFSQNYLFYLIANQPFIDYATNFSNGTRMPRANWKVISKSEWLVPKEIKDQQKIASILSAYDDLIENNTRRIKILEDMAQAIYKEWFVNFRFPGYEKVKFVDSPLGKIPEGWEVKKIGERFLTVLGGTPSRSKTEYWDDGNIPWINSGKVNDLRIIDESEFITELGLKKSSTKLMPKRTTVVAITGATLGQVSITEIETCANQSVVGINDKENLYNEFIYLKFCEIIEELILSAGGGAQQHINKDIVNRTEFLCPPSSIVIDFNKIIIPLFDEMRNLLFKNQNLRKTRDLLLPKLISGEVPVSAETEPGKEV